MYLTTTGLVLRVSPYNDTDAMLTILTGEYGKLSAKARGLRRKNSPLSAPCQLLTFGEFTLFGYKGTYTVNEAQCIELFNPLRRDLQKLSLGTYFAQVAEVLSQEDMPSPQLLSLTLNCLYALCQLPISEVLIKAVFELRASAVAGYMPDLGGCQHCGNLQPDRFDLSGGCLVCSRCGNMGSSGIRVPVTPGCLDAMRYICHCSDKKLFSFCVSDETATLLSSLTESYLSTQLERGFSTLDFYKSLIIQPDNFR